MRHAQKQFANFCKSLSIFDYLSNKNPEIDTGLSDGKMGCLGCLECPYFVPCTSEDPSDKWWGTLMYYDANYNKL